MGFIIPQDPDLILQRRSPLPVNLILQNIAGLVVGRRLHKFAVQADRLLKIVHPCGDLRHLVEQHTSYRCAVIGDVQNLHTILIPLHRLIHLADDIEHVQIFHATPVDGIGNLRRRLIIFLFR